MKLVLHFLFFFHVIWFQLYFLHCVSQKEISREETLSRERIFWKSCSTAPYPTGLYLMQMIFPETL